MLLLLLLGLASAYTLTGSLTPPKPTRERYQAQPSHQSTKLILDGNQVSFPTDHGHFQFFDVAEGAHFLEVHDVFYTYPIVLVEVSSSGISAYDATPSALRHEKISYPLKLAAEKPVTFYEKREPFSISQLLLNPMMLVLGVTILFAFISPKAMLDPEQMKEMKEMQKKMSKDMSGNWLASLMQPPS